MAYITHAHITLLKKLDDKVHKFEELSATKKKQVLDMVQHDLLFIENDSVEFRAKATNLILHLEAEANDFLKKNG